jgi:hypothetical protein
MVAKWSSHDPPAVRCAIKLSQNQVKRSGMIDRRQFGAGIAAFAFGGLAARLSAATPAIEGYGPLMEDPAGLIDLPSPIASSPNWASG